MRIHIAIMALAATTLAGCSTVVALLPEGMRPVKYDLKTCSAMFPQLEGLNVVAGVTRENEKSLTGVWEVCVTQILGKADYGFEWEFVRKGDFLSSEPQSGVLVWEGKGCVLTEHGKSNVTSYWRTVTAVEPFETGGCATLLWLVSPRHISAHSGSAKREVSLRDARGIATRLTGVKN
jgi:uncharacterized protein YceK